MSGVRGFVDPNYQINEKGGDVFDQFVKPIIPKHAKAIANVAIRALGSTINTPQGTLLPWHVSYLGGNWSDISKCMIGGNDSWSTQHAAFDNGANDQWALKNSPYSMAHFTRDDIPTHFGIAEDWTVGDMYHVCHLPFGVMTVTH